MRSAASLAAAFALGLGAASALETDPYYSWGQPLADATPVISAKLNLELERVVAEASRRSREAPCRTLAKRLRSRLHHPVLQDFELWALQSALVPRSPATPEEELAARETDLFSRSGPLDFGMWLPPSPTIEISGVRIGTDKLAHFVSSGWRYYVKYERALRRGESAADAERAVIRWGFLEERSVNGTLTSGVFSIGDLESNYGGMQFFLDLCHGDDPILRRDGGVWRIARPIDVARYVTPGWDEAFTPSVFTKSRWGKIRPVLLDSCARRTDPEVVMRRARNLADNRETPTAREVAEEVQAGKLRDPRGFGLEANCPPPAAPPADALVDAAPPPPAPAAPSVADLVEAIRAEEDDRRRRAFTLIGVQFSTPLTLAGSLGVLIARPPTTTHCRTMCQLDGFFAQVEPGLDGGRISAGYVTNMFAERGTHERFLSDIYYALGFKASLLRPWGDSSIDPEDQVLAGAEVEFTITRVNFSLGVFHRVAGAATDDPWVVSGGLGWGF